MKPTRPAVVMVDDEKPYLDFLATMLATSRGWTVHTFTRPQEALAALPTLEVGVIVTDYFMPELNGLDFVRAAAQLRPGVPCIMISGHAEELAEEPRAQGLPLCALLAKPFSWSLLVAEIERHAPAFTAADDTPAAPASV